jgi:hypothetical protein
MAPPKRNDEPTCSSVLERVARLESDAEHTCRDISDMERRMNKRLDRIETKMDDMPKMLGDAVASAKTSAFSIRDWRVILGILAAMGLGVKPIIDSLGN